MKRTYNLYKNYEIELVVNDGVIKRVSAGQKANDEPTAFLSSTRKFSIPASLRAIAIPIPAAPPPTTTAS